MFLDGKETVYPKIALQAYPKSGSLYVRKLLQAVTGVYTGSAESNELSLAEVLTENMPGSEVTCDSNRVWITKTHWPVIDDQFKPKSFSA